MAKNTCGYLWRLQQLDIRDNKYVICVINKLRKNTKSLKEEKATSKCGVRHPYSELCKLYICVALRVAWSMGNNTIPIFKNYAYKDM